MLLECTVIQKVVVSNLPSSKGTILISRFREQDEKFSLQMFSEAGLHKEAKSSGIALALEYLAGLFCLLLQSSFLNNNNKKKIHTRTANRSDHAFCSHSLSALLMRSSRPHLTVWGKPVHCEMKPQLYFQAPRPFSDVDDSSWRQLGQLNLLFKYFITRDNKKYEATSKNEKYWKMDCVFYASLSCCV